MNAESELKRLGLATDTQSIIARLKTLAQGWFSSAYGTFTASSAVYLYDIEVLEGRLK